MNVIIKRLSPDAQIPAYAHATDAGFDLVAAAGVIIEPGATARVPTGLAFEIPEGYEMQIRPRSGITLKTPLRVQLGTVDAGYRGEVGVIVDNIAQKDVIGIDLNYKTLEYVYAEYPKTIDGSKFSDWQYFRNKLEGTYIIRKGDRIAQALIKPVEQAVFTEVDALGDSDRGTGGFGSSGVGSPHPEYFGEPTGKERI